MGMEVCGYIDVKVPSKGRKFGQWKAWRRQWCIVRCGEGNTIQLVLGNGHNSPTSCIDIPHNAVLCRSESRSRMFAFGIFCPSSMARFRQPLMFLAGRSETETQRWMLQIRNLISRPKIPVEAREWTVSLIDNEHSRTAGLSGLYGTLTTGTTGVTVSDPSTGQIKVHWRWSQVHSTTLQDSTNTEDDRHILLLQTSSEFSCGEGELQLFSLAAGELEAALSKYQSKPQCRLITSPLPPLPSNPLLAARRLSRSEGDLRLWPADSNYTLFHLRTQSMSRNTSHDKQVASSLVTAGLGLLLTTPGCSEPDSLHDYQCLDSLWPEPGCEDTLPDLPDFRRQQFQNRRESGVSIASGIYEEIEELPDDCYQRMDRFHPPPLPPRKHETSGSEEEYSIPDQSLIYSTADEKEEEPLYLPMSPGGRKEDTYVVMANLINKNSHFSEPVV